MPTCPDSVKRLIEHFDRQADQVRSADYNETTLRIQFINPLFAELGWDIDNRQGFAPQYAEVVHEDRVKVAGATKAPDYSFRIGGVRKFFLEAKKPFVNIKENWEPAYQLRRYAWSAKLAVSLLTDFEELAIYDCRVAPRQLERPSVARREYIRHHDYPTHWEFLEGTFSKRAVLTGEFDRYCATKKGRGAQEFDDKFLEEIEDWRKKLASNLALRNSSLNEQSLNFAVQRIIDRIIFLRICEDRGVEPTGNFQQLLNGEKTYARLKTVFHAADDRYNSGLFHFRPEKGRDEAPDELTPALEIDDAALKAILKRLYYPESPYEFSVVSADILGSVYERFLGSVIELSKSRRVTIEPKPEVRKAGGVYYTPTYIVDYIVKQTVGRLLEESDEAPKPGSDEEKEESRKPESPKARSEDRAVRTPREAAKLKVLDPACGSGSFLLGAYQYLLDWHLRWYVADGQEKWSRGKNATIRPADRPAQTTTIQNPNSTIQNGQHWALTTRERKRILLENIHGVDIDFQAVEVTKLSLLLKCLEGETAESLRAGWRLFHERALPDLGRNIQCGNSLIGTDIMTTEAWREMSEDERRRVNPFDYELAFPQVFKRRDAGFDAVIGNPPYVQIENIPPADKEYYLARYGDKGRLGKRYDLYQVFVMQALTLVADDGRMGFILPNTFLMGHSYELLRTRVTACTSITEIVDLPQGVFEGVTVDNVLLLLHRDSNPLRRSQNAIAIHKLSPKSDKSRVAVADWDESFDIAQAVLVNDDAFRINVHANPQQQRLFAKLERSGHTLGDVTESSQGIILYKTAKDALAPKYTGFAKKPGWAKLLRGKNIGRYETRWTGEYVHYGDWLWCAREPKYFNQPKILLHAMRNKSLARRLVGTYDDNGHYNAHNLANIVAKPGSSLDLRYILGIFNSALINYWYKAHFPNVNINPADFRQIPLPRLDVGGASGKCAHDQMVSLVTSMLSLHVNQAEVETPHRLVQVSRQIEATDRQIDQLVYQLYGLTDAEIRLVEEATQQT